MQLRNGFGEGGKEISEKGEVVDMEAYRALANDSKAVAMCN